jgi:group I intron endonuclease
MYGIIYKAINEINGKCYIGQTTKNLKRRITQHICDSRYKGRHKSYFHNAITKYGEDSFKWVVLKECYDQDELNNSERHYINEFNTLSPNGYNLTVGGYTSPMINPTEEVLKNHRDGCKRAMKKYTGKNNVMKRPDVIQKHKKAVNNKERRMKQSEFMKNNSPNKQISTIIKKCKYYIIFKSPSNQIHEIYNLKKFCRDNDLCYTSIRGLVNNRIKCNNHKGWIVLYKKVR